MPASRRALIAVHYRQALDFSDASLEAATAAVDRLDAAMSALAGYAEPAGDDAGLDDVLAGTRARFDAAMADDLNVSAALAALFELVREANRRVADRMLSTAGARRLAASMRELDTVLAILPDEMAPLPSGAEELLAARAAARARREWAESDRLRGELASRGVIVEDTRDGQRWRLLEGAS
jgi:cysteinyl-tRNA synthetase